MVKRSKRRNSGQKKKKMETNGMLLGYEKCREERVEANMEKKEKKQKKKRRSKRKKLNEHEF